MTDAATQAQIDAADPNSSTWLSANAGSGKTRVLTDRVALLLLQGVLPQRILCLTYTKAAASEMQNRLFKRLGEWAMMPDDALDTSLQALGVKPGTINSSRRREARRLFAKAIETPGGLKIQTIHSFCASLLRRFPLEAKVSPAFTEMDDRATKLLRADVLDHMAQSTPDLVQELARHFTGEDPDSLLAEIAKHPEAFAAPVSREDIKTTIGLPNGIDAFDDILKIAFNGTEAVIVAQAVPVLASYSKTMVALADQLAGLNLTAPTTDDLTTLFELFLFKKDGQQRPEAKFKTVPTEKVQKDPAFPLSEFQDFMERVAAAKDVQLGLKTLDRTMALHAFAPAFLDRMAKAKQQRGLLDFDDLIQKARALLKDSTVAAWVLFRLDGGIDHILVDEAQDTSPAQWDVVRLLAQEFTAGQGARSEARTIFVVGDKKQSIYSFQGADPAEFDRMCDEFEQRLEAIQTPLAKRELLYSFRSAAPILALVDSVFTEELRQGMGAPLDHKAFKAALPGRVDLWDWVPKPEEEKKDNWFDPVDTVGTDHESVQLAKKIADHILDQTLHGQITVMTRENGQDKELTRPIRPRDFLILVQSRSAQGQLFHEIIRACKNLGLPMAGADRLRVGGELGVRDLVALLSFLETPQDDLALAEVMRSPLGGLSEQDLFALAHDRPSSLWDQLANKRDDYPNICTMLDDLRDQADFMRPYDLLERALTRHHGRERLLDRLGPEAEEGITALLDQALNYEQTEAPTLTGFLTWLSTDDVTIKRQMDSEGDFIRVMTVHGAKGLEAPIVILPQTGTQKNDIRDDILIGDDLALWKAKSDEATRAQTAIVNAKKDLKFQERMRLLYVALTRAESWLIVCGCGKPSTSGTTWYEIVENGLARAGGVAADGVKLRLDHLTWPERTARRDLEMAHALPDVAPIYHQMPIVPPAIQSALSPSQLGGAKVLAGVTDGLSENDAKARGTAIHTLLENLSSIEPSQRLKVSQRLLEGYENPLNEDLLAHVNRVLDAPDLAFLFDSNALAEVEISATLPELKNRSISGAIDRLVISDDSVLAVDFKSNKLVPDRPEDTPDGLLRQMGAYGAALAQIYPDHRIETAIVWTETAKFMSLPHDIVRQALLQTHIS